jgi:hypothetical protein
MRAELQQETRPNFGRQRGLCGILGWMVHLANVEEFAGGVRVTALGLGLGLAQVLVYAYLGAWLLASLHERFLVRH